MFAWVAASSTASEIAIPRLPGRLRVLLEHGPAGGRERGRARVALGPPDLHHHLAVRLLLVRRPDHVDRAVHLEVRGREREGRAPLPGTRLGGEPLDPGLAVVVGLRHGRVRLVAAGRADPLVLVVDLRGRLEVLLEAAGAEERARAPEAEDVDDLLGDVDVPLGRHLLPDQLHREDRREVAGRRRFARLRVERRVERGGQVGLDIVPPAGHLLLVEVDLGLHDQGLSCI